ncbi:Aluminum-activated malate transporter 1 [Ananas comosus]|uniref:Aluminum-activated malate transporter 1 n=1 Tax=Ananas comosus TaxID=4615 RepID=A0A199W600_ANACO|nr:Aluminum-activated malate transporter 1 [Ananas comosus]
MPSSPSKPRIKPSIHTTPMEVEVGSNTSAHKIGFSPWWSGLSSLVERMKEMAVGLSKKVKKIVKDDPRRVAHCFKVGLALTIVSIFYYVTPLYEGLGVSTMWAVLTVVVVMEYTVGGTLSKGLNRAFATLLAGSLGVGAHQIAVLCGDKGEPILLGLFVFTIAAGATFSRFIPEIKARYDYGVTIFILTFSLVAVSSYRVEELIQMAHQRVSTIAIGVATCLGTTVFVFPVWAGEDLHKQVANNLDKLATFLEGLEAECFGEKARCENLESKSFFQVYKSVLNSKPSEDSLFNFAKWEPGHGQFGFRHPWKQYQKLGALSRQCASAMDTLSSYITTFPKSQATATDVELRLQIRAACAEMSSESAKALRELSSAIRTMTAPASANRHVAASLEAAANLRSALSEDVALSEIVHLAIISSLLAELVLRTAGIAGSVEELARLARFKQTEPARRSTVKPVDVGEKPAQVAINVED